MQKIINKKLYDTESASLIKRYTNGYYGTPDGYEESLYQTKDGFYFLYVNGGPQSPYPKEDIIRIGKAKVQNWIDSH